MTPKKDIVRRPVYTLDDGSPVPSMGDEFTMKESRFIFWYTCPGTEAFMNSGRAAVRAGYKESSAVWQGYQLRQKPRIAQKVNSRLVSVHEELKDMVYRIAAICSIRMSWTINEFYRDGKMTVNVKGKPKEIKVFEIIPLKKLSLKQRMCIDGITYKGPHNIPLYILPNREKAYRLFMKCYEILMPITDNEEMNWKETAEIIRENAGSPVIAPRDGKAPKDAIEAL
jgi:hypothetical protein